MRPASRRRAREGRCRAGTGAGRRPRRRRRRQRRRPRPRPQPAAGSRAGAKADGGDRVKASPLARRLAEQQGIDLAGAQPARAPAAASSRPTSTAATGKAPPRPTGRPPPQPAPAAAAPALVETEIPHEVVKLSNMRKTIARRLTEAKQTIPHIYLTVDIRLDALLKLRGELNEGLESRGVKLSVNDMLIKALAVALIEVPECNVSISGDQLLKYQPRRHLGRGVDPRRPDHADRRRRRHRSRSRRSRTR